MTADRSGTSTLVIIPCGKAKIWNRDPAAGPTLARDAYTGGPFKVNRGYAEAHGTTWLILSAKYGLIQGDYVLPGPYDTSFKHPHSGPISVDQVAAQIGERQLASFSRVVVLGGREYVEVARRAFRTFGQTVETPFAGLPVGKAMQAIKAATPGTALPVPNEPIPLPFSRIVAVDRTREARGSAAGRGLPRSDDFRAKLEELLETAAAQGLRTIEIRAGELHRLAGGGSGPDNRMASCCSAMYGAKRPDDTIVSAPPKGKGPTLTICYQLPR